MVQAIIAPNGPVAVAKARGSEKMPAPTIDPTTMVVSANSVNFSVRSDTAAGPALGAFTRACWLSIGIPPRLDRSSAE
jgi:hypothetical protein